MRIVETYSHLNGLEFLMVHKPGLWSEIQAVVDSIQAGTFKTKVSQEKTKLGKLLYAPVELNKAMNGAFARHGWKESRTSYWVTKDAKLIRRTMNLPASEQRKAIEATGLEAISSYNQTDFTKERVAVEVQFGKYSFVAFDLFVKHMAFFVGDIIDLGVEILPMKELQREMSSGPGYYEGPIVQSGSAGKRQPAGPIGAGRRGAITGLAAPSLWPAKAGLNGLVSQLLPLHRLRHALGRRMVLLLRRRMPGVRVGRLVTV